MLLLGSSIYIYIYFGSQMLLGILVCHLICLQIEINVLSTLKELFLILSPLQ